MGFGDSVVKRQTDFAVLMPQGEKETATDSKNNNRKYKINKKATNVK